MENMTFCQSCGMPLTTDEHFGTEQGGGKSVDYCAYCYQNGEFTDALTMEQMIDICVPHVVKANPSMSEEQARKQMEQYMPTLKRWR
jgi:hypothetical protein